MISKEDSTPTEEITDEMDEGFVDDSTAAPSTSEHLLTVGAGAIEEEEEEVEEEEDDEEPADELCTIHTVCELPLHKITMSG